MSKSIFIVALAFFCYTCVSAQTNDSNKDNPRQYFSLQGGLTLLEAPVVLYPNIGLNYSRTFLGRGAHQLAFNPQFQFLIVPNIEQKFLLSANLEYKFQPKWRFEANVFAGLNYQLRKYAYDRYEFKNDKLENVGNTQSQVGPTLGFQLGYKVFKREKFSLSPYVGFTLTKLRNSYTNSLAEGFVPTGSFGIKLSLK